MEETKGGITTCAGLFKAGVRGLSVKEWAKRKRESAWVDGILHQTVWERRGGGVSPPPRPLVYLMCGVFHLLFLSALALAMIHLYVWSGDALLSLALSKPDAWCMIYNRDATFVNRCREAWLTPLVSREGEFPPGWSIGPRSVSFIKTVLSQADIPAELPLLLFTPEGPGLSLHHTYTFNNMKFFHDGESSPHANVQHLQGGSNTSSSLDLQLQSHK